MFTIYRIQYFQVTIRHKYNKINAFYNSIFIELDDVKPDVSDIIIVLRTCIDCLRDNPHKQNKRMVL